jgi:hypothetical protein
LPGASRFFSRRREEQYATAVFQFEAVAAHAALQQFLHRFQASHELVDVVELFLSQLPPSIRSRRIWSEAMEEHFDFGDREACNPSEFDYGQLEAGFGRESSLAALSRSPRKDSRSFVKSNRGSTDSRFTCKFANSHVSCRIPLDLKCTLRISIFTSSLQDLQSPRLRTYGENMQSLSFRQLPVVVKIAVGLVFYNAWWSIEEFVINRYGLWKYMPHYKVADPCVWDLAVGLIIVIAIWRASRQGKSQAA